MPKKLLALLLFLASTTTAFANFDFNANCQQAYTNILSLKLKRARVLIDQEKAARPNNAITVLLDNYYDYFWLLTSESKADFDRLKDNKSKRLNLLEDEDDHSPYYNFSLAQVNLQWALIHSRFGENTTAGFEINRAWKLLNANNKKFPGFLPDDIPRGLVNVLLGALPDGALKSALSFFGVKGNINTGLNSLQQLASKLPHTSYAMYYDELVFYLTYVQSYVLNDPAAYIKMHQYIAQMDSGSLLKTYVRAFVSLRTGHSSEAIKCLNERPDGGEYQPYPYLTYLEAVAKMNRLDNNADDYFRRFLAENKGVSYVKDTYLHLAWDAALHGDNKGYQSYIQQVKAKGYSFNDKDKQALTEAANPTPNADLLRARLLFDGGYYDKALDILDGKNPESYPSAGEKADYYYRLGRVYEAMGKNANALQNYQQAINTGKGTPYYYGPMSAVKMGNIYEEQKNKPEATHYYNMAIAFKNHQFENSVEQKAKEGLKRLGY
ncbi:tetratricopeptide repeat protein [Mucilaginibacter ginkgonis]|uniref:Tetratricopeptide repeat protein n=1 Tax=Mucilaginibacter ginkgonis TaxID=2682091 RepID=A0A6I4IND5_9SPHI|nr:tetratricopeptide repeat protein [Mucilaginibacter ginkgonis]QQL49316.1 tetratricopeptide repeat protein [Mucilaginibacter ginkgonis]